MRAITSDSLSAELNAMLQDERDRVNGALVTAVTKGTRKAASEWRRNARQQFPVGQTYRKHGKEYTSGAYAKSIRSHVESKGNPSGVIHSSMSGLPHLLEFGHAKVGGGRVEGREHVAPAAEVAFDHTMDVLREELGR